MRDEDTKRRAGINFAARPSVERWFRRRRGSAVLTASIVPKLGERRLHDLLSSRRGSADIPAPSLHKLSGRRLYLVIFISRRAPSRHPSPSPRPSSVPSSIPDAFGVHRHSRRSPVAFIRGSTSGGRCA